MIDVVVNNRTELPELILWLDEHGIEYVTDYSVCIDGTVAYNEDIVFYPKFVFNSGVNELVIMEFSLRFS